METETNVKIYTTTINDKYIKDLIDSIYKHKTYRFLRGRIKNYKNCNFELSKIEYDDITEKGVIFKIKYNIRIKEINTKNMELFGLTIKGYNSIKKMYDFNKQIN